MSGQAQIVSIIQGAPFVIVSPHAGHGLGGCFNPEWDGADVK